MDPATSTVPATARPRLSTLALLGMVAVGGVVFVSIFAYIFLIATLSFDAQLWWMGLASFAFALPTFLLYAATGDRHMARPLAGGFFLLGAGSFYASILLSPDSSPIKILWLVVLSMIVLAVLGAVFLVARESEADAARRARRKVTP